MSQSTPSLDAWARHSAEWRDPAQVASQWKDASSISPGLLRSRATPGWWDTLEKLGVTLFVTREYEHLVMALDGADPRRISYFPLPHPSGLAADRTRGRLWVASSRNPNQVFRFQPASAVLARRDVAARPDPASPMTPVSSFFYPGSLYLHDLALIGGNLYGSAAGHNAIVRLRPGGFEPVWWSKAVDTPSGPAFDRNYVQLNSIAAASTLRDSFFTASSNKIGRRRPGHLDYPVNGAGVLLSGRTREPFCSGFTRPHSARLGLGRIWVANSGYGEISCAEPDGPRPVCRLPGWTRGLCLIGDVLFAGTSRVIPRFSRYAPGLDLHSSRCAVHAVSCLTGKRLGSIEWPEGNQIFAIDWLPSALTRGFLFQAGARTPRRHKAFFYSYSLETSHPGEP